MARPQIASDKQILDAAEKVLARSGPDAFTLAEVAKEVGLSRAAIILRFKSTQALKVMLLSRMHEQFIAFVETFPTSPGGDQLLEIAASIANRAGSRKGSSSYFAGYHANQGDRAIAELEARRGAALRLAVIRVMPQVTIARELAADVFMSHVTGSLIKALSRTDTTIRAYIVKQTAAWLRLAGIPYSEATVVALSSSRAKTIRNTSAVKTLAARRATSKRAKS